MGLVGQVRVPAGGKLQTDLAHLTSACDLVDRGPDARSVAQLLLVLKQVKDAGLGVGSGKPRHPVETDYSQ